MTIDSDLAKRLWGAADELWTNSGLQPSEYSTPVLALIFLKYADFKFSEVEQALKGSSRRRRKGPSKDDYLASGVLFIPEKARYQTLLEMPEGANVGKAVNDAMKAIEAENPELKDVLPKTYGKFEATTLASLLKTFGAIPMDVDGDIFGRIYEYFLGNFAPMTLQKGGEFYTPVSIVRLIVDIVEPYHGRILDPACGSGGMFVQSAHFVGEHKKRPSDELSCFGIEKISQTLRLCKMNLAVHGLSGDIREANSYYEDIHGAPGKFDFVMANPPFNQNAVDKARIKDDTARYPFGMPTPDNANYLWIQLFYSALNKKGRAGFVMANSASDARGTEMEIRKKLIESGHVDVVVSVSGNFFYTVTLPVTLWFLNKAKNRTKQKGTVLFIDAREIFTQVDRAHRDWTPKQTEFLANIVRVYRKEKPEKLHDGKGFEKKFKGGKYQDVPGLCKVATLEEIEEQGWSLNPGRYVGVGEKVEDDGDFAETFEKLNEQLLQLNQEATILETAIQQNVLQILDGLNG
jgi:type I restriction enzyme M protein